MKNDVPFLMIGLQIPVLADTTVDVVMEAIAGKVAEALEEIRREQANRSQQEESETADEAPPVPRVTVGDAADERLESYTEKTHEDLLASLGYRASA